MYRIYRAGIVGVVMVITATLVFTGCPNVLDSDGSGGSSRSNPPVYVIGDVGPAGGRIFYVDEDNEFDWTYLEAWIDDEIGTYLWKTDNTSTPGTSQAIGSGHANTYTTMSGTEHPVAQVARNARHGGFNDWFLPSKDELYLMYQRRGYIDDLRSWKWSSSEYSYGSAWVQNFTDGPQRSYGKNASLPVRVIRAF